MNRRQWMIFAPAFALTACGGKQNAAATPGVDTSAVAPAATAADSVTSAADTGVKAADSAAKAAAAAPKATAPKVEKGDYDQATKPRFKIDEKTGKIDTIRKP